MIQGLAEDALRSALLDGLRGSVQLVFSSPPFPLNRKKKYGNLTGQDYIEWLAGFAPLLKGFLAEDGSIVMELGNAWEPGEPIMSTLALEALLAFLKEAKLHLCQQFIAYNRARLPSPAQWVNVERIRVKDAYTHIWWMSPTARPKADNRRVLKKYSPAMLELLASGRYNAGKRPSEHNIGATSFLTNNKGAIPSNVLSVSNTRANDEYMAYCRKKNLPFNPARMPKEIPDFFISFLTEPGDLVLDPFAGSNVTGAVAETLGRKWVAIERDPVYAKTSRSRFRQSRINGHPRNPGMESYPDIVLDREKRGRKR
jgi:site-specific DNA-methyltransferase (cytosine-N4-specific)